MAIRTIYVYSPFSNSGRITGLNTYCGGNVTHYPCNSGFSSPVDIAATGNIYLRATNIKSCITRITYTCCTNYSGCGNDYRRTIIVDLYGKENAVCYIGSVAFGHIIAASHIAHNQIYNFNNNPYKLPFLLGSATSGGCPDQPPKCSTGTHSHMEQKKGTRMSLSCGQTVNSGTAIYKFTWDDSIPCPI